MTNGQYNKRARFLLAAIFTALALVVFLILKNY